MRTGPLSLGLSVVVALAALLPLLSGASAGPVPLGKPLPPPAAGGIVGNLTGPSLLPTRWNGTFYLNATGGPAVVSGSIVGTINWTAQLSGGNTTGSSVTPSNGTIENSTAQPITLKVATGAIVEKLTLTVEVRSTLGTSNKTANFSATFAIVSPYTVRATLVAGPGAAILPFNVTVTLDGAAVGNITVPKLSPNETYDLVFRYPTTGLGSGEHTFTLSLADEHGLVTFADGQTVLSTTFYVAPPASSNTLWYVVGIIAFFGVLFIYATRVAARRRGPARR